MRTGEATTPAGMRLYAIGDIHGCADKLALLHERIAADLAARPTPDHRIIHIGDYGDRGADTAGVVARLAGMTDDARIVFLRGNHDQKWLDFLADGDLNGAAFLSFGGKATARSYGVGNRTRNYADLSAALAAAMPPEHRAFLDTTRTSVRFGDYFFTHAGVRPGVPLDAQTDEDLMWIREEFLLDTRDFGVVVVHGHTVTPSMTPEIHANRIAIDTGAVFGGPLTCVVLEGTGVRFIAA
ncbi:MAG TPA: metallophosphoesterase [Bauldia sp.]|nr:metallophosphoesterase [Bauldia sp.]